MTFDPPIVGRPLLVAEDGVLYLARGYTIYRSHDRGRSWVQDAVLAAPLSDRLAARVRMSARLLRREVTWLRVLASGARVAIARDGIYRADAGSAQMARTWQFATGRPLNFAVDGSGRLIFGEYRSNAERTAIAIFVSTDEGRSFTEAHRFAAREVRHVHSLTWDPYLGRSLVMTGDYEQECGIGALSDNLQSVDWILRGGQRARAVAGLVDETSIVYGTDSHVEQNYILRLNKASGTVEQLATIEGSSLFAARFGKLRVISTCVEPSPVNDSRDVSLYVSVDGESWNRLCTRRKDWLHPTWFQFGTLVLPYSESRQDWGVFSGQAVEEIDGLSFVFSAENSA